MLNVVIVDAAARDIQHLSNELKQRVKAKLEQLAVDPKAYSRKLINNEIGDYRSRVGDYRIIFDLEGDDLVVLKVGHRRDVYK